MFLISFSREFFFSRVMKKKSRPARVEQREERERKILEIHISSFSSRFKSRLDSHMFKIMTCLRANEMRKIQQWNDTEADTHRKKKVIILVHHTRAIEQTLCNIPPTFAVVWHHLTTGMPSQLNMNGEREMITNYFDISFCSSLSRRFFLPQQHSPVCSFMAFLNRLHGATEMLLISWASRMSFTLPPVKNTKSHFYRISSTHWDCHRKLSIISLAFVVHFSRSLCDIVATLAVFLINRSSAANSTFHWESVLSFQ